jgi:hypothetical protein
MRREIVANSKRTDTAALDISHPNIVTAVIYGLPMKRKGSHTRGPMEENLLTAKQVARYLRVDRFTVYRLVSQKKSWHSKSAINGASSEN